MVFIDQFSSNASDVNSDTLRNKVREFESEIISKLINRGYKEVLNPYLLSEKNLELQEIDERDYIKTKRGFMPFDESSKWLPTLESSSNKMNLPIRLFSSYQSIFDGFKLSVVIMDKNVDMESIHNLCRSILSKESSSLSYKRKKASKPLSQKERVLLDEDDIGECGLFSFSVLSNFNIDEPVGYLNIDIASLIAQEVSLSVQEVLYPQLTGRLVLTDEEISETLKIDKEPFTELGKSVKNNLSDRISKERVKGSKESFKLLETIFKGKDLQVWVLSEDEATSDGLFSEVYVWNGSLYAIPKANVGEAFRRIKKEGSSTGISLVDSISSRIAWEIEHMDGERKFIELNDIVSLESANIELPRNLKGQVNLSDFEADLNLKLELRLLQSD